MDDDMSKHDAKHLIKPPPPIYIKGVIDYQGLRTELTEHIGQRQFHLQIYNGSPQNLN